MTNKLAALIIVSVLIVCSVPGVTATGTNPASTHHWSLRSLPLLSSRTSATLAQQTKEPDFSSYPASVWQGKTASLKLNSHPYTRKFRTVVREQLKEFGVNFAGHYTIAAAGCGTGCSVTGIIDTRTGDAYFPNEFDGWTAIVGEYEWKPDEDVRTFHRDSRLLRVVGRPNAGKPGEEKFGPSGIYYYEWHRNRLRLIKFVPVGSYPDGDPK